MIHCYTARDNQVEDNEETHVPSVDNIMRMRADKKTFRWVAENLFVPATANRSLTQGVVKKQLVRDWCSVSTEAFVYLVAENFKKDTGTKSTFDGQWTTGTKRGGGWDKKGIKRYNEIFDLVETDRDWKGQVDEDLLQEYIECNTGASKKTGGNVVVEDDDEDEPVAKRSGNFKKDNNNNDETLV